MTVYTVTIEGKEVAVSIDDQRRITMDGEPIETDIRMVGEHRYSVLLGGDSVTLNISGSEGNYTVQTASNEYDVSVESERGKLMRAFGRANSATSGRFELRAPMPALVVAVKVSPGDQVVAGDGLIVLEAMKMENDLKAPIAGTVKSVLAKAGQPVEKGELLILLE